MVFKWFSVVSLLSGISFAVDIEAVPYNISHYIL